MNDSVPNDPRDLLARALQLIAQDLQRFAERTKPRSVAEMAAISRYARDLQSMAGAAENEQLKVARELSKLSNAELKRQVQLAQELT